MNSKWPKHGQLMSTAGTRPSKSAFRLFGLESCEPWKPMNPIPTKAERLSLANAVILQIATHGRKFFYSSRHVRFAQFEIDGSGRLRWIDEHSGKAIAVIKGCRWRGFTHGGTMRALVEALARYIRDGAPISLRHFGPWPDHVCDGDLWGYGRDQMAALRLALRDNPAVTDAKCVQGQQDGRLNG